MAKVIFTPWTNHSELLAVRNQFYAPPGYDGPDMRSQACATVGAWKLRGNLPHPVEATALLTDAILHDDALKNSVFSIRATYSAAFCRFVTGLVDSKLYGQRKTMFQRAVDLGLPASFVELRHEATHRELPSLTVLRNSTQRSLEWLWDFYWVKTDPGPGLPPATLGIDDSIDGDVADGVEAVKDSLRAVLEQATVDGEGSEPPRKKRKFQQHLAGVATQVVSILRASQAAATALPRVMLEDGILVPSGRRLGDPLTETIAKWDPLLQSITEGHPVFLVTLTETMVDALAFSGSSDTKNDPYCEGVYTWLDHIFRSAQWDSKRRYMSYSYVLAVCKGSSNHWTTLLAKSIDEKGNQLPEIAGRRESLPDGPTGETGTLPADIDDDLKALSKYGWETDDRWDSRPLGIV